MLKTKKQNKKKKGFTLIELIVVLAVLAIIALIAIPNFNGIRENSKVKSDERSCDLIEKAVQTLIQEPEGAPNDGTYYLSQNGVTHVMPSRDAETTTADEASAKKIETVIGENKSPQAKDKDYFIIDISNSGKSDAEVEVTTGPEKTDGK